MSDTIYILNGPNLNLLGRREPHIYGHQTLADVEADCRRVAAEFSLAIKFQQSNAEFQLIDWIHEARDSAAAIIINPEPSRIPRLPSWMRSTPVAAQSWRCTSPTCIGGSPFASIPMCR